MPTRTPDLVMAEMIAQYALQIARQQAEIERLREQVVTMQAEQATQQPVKAE